jgi:hypothetical protein
MPKFCQACGMPLVNKEDFALGDESSDFCQYCVSEDGDVKPCEDIFEGGVQFFMSQFGGDREQAEKITRKNMLNQEYWKGKDIEILKGDVATDEEFAEVMKKLS